MATGPAALQFGDSTRRQSAVATGRRPRSAPAATTASIKSVVIPGDLRSVYVRGQETVAQREEGNIFAILRNEATS